MLLGKSVKLVALLYVSVAFSWFSLFLNCPSVQKPKCAVNQVTQPHGSNSVNTLGFGFGTPISLLFGSDNCSVFLQKFQEDSILSRTLHNNVFLGTSFTKKNDYQYLKKSVRYWNSCVFSRMRWWRYTPHLCNSVVGHFADLTRSNWGIMTQVRCL